MFTVTPHLYRETAIRLREAVSGCSYFSGSISFSSDNIDCKLTASLVICRQSLDMPEEELRCISDIVPVWWHFATFRDGTEILNDFSFGDLKEFML